MHSFIFFSPPPFLSFPYFPSLISSFIYFFLLLITGSFSTPFLFLLSSFSDDLTFTQYCLNFATVVYTEVAQTVIQLPLPPLKKCVFRDLEVYGLDKTLTGCSIKKKNHFPCGILRFFLYHPYYCNQKMKKEKEKPFIKTNEYNYNQMPGPDS